jgi:hypothetical protein
MHLHLKDAVLLSQIKHLVQTERDLVVKILQPFARLNDADCSQI